MAFGLFSEDKGNYVDVWMIKTNQTDMDLEMDVGFFQK